MEVFIQFCVTVVAGALGTFIGGMFLDYIRKKNTKRQNSLACCPR